MSLFSQKHTVRRLNSEATDKTLNSHWSPEQTAGKWLRIMNSPTCPLKTAVCGLCKWSCIDRILAPALSLLPALFALSGTFSPTEVSIASSSLTATPPHPPLPLHPSPHPILPPVLLYLSTESAFQSSMPQACREAAHGLNYAPSDTHSTSDLLSLFSLSLYKVAYFSGGKGRSAPQDQEKLKLLGILNFPLAYVWNWTVECRFWSWKQNCVNIWCFGFTGPLFAKPRCVLNINLCMQNRPQIKSNNKNVLYLFLILLVFGSPPHCFGISWEMSLNKTENKTVSFAWIWRPTWHLPNDSWHWLQQQLAGKAVV